MAIALVRDRDAAEDLLQEAWLAILAKPPRHGSNLRGYLARLLQRLSFRKLRETRRRGARERAVTPREALPGGADVVARAEIHRRTVAAVLALEEPYRTTILLRFFDDLTPSEIAEREGVPLETARTRQKRALAMLRARLEQEGRDWREEWLVALIGGSWPRAKPAGWRAAPGLRQAGLALGLVATSLVAWLIVADERADSRAKILATNVPTRASESLGLSPAAPQRTELPPASPALMQEPAPSWRGLVTDEAGRALPNVHVELWVDRFDHPFDLGNTQSDAEGRFACPLASWNDLSPEGRSLLGLSVRAYARGRGIHHRALELGPDGLPIEATLVLASGRLLIGRVLVPTGEPAGRIRVEVRLRNDEPERSPRVTEGLTNQDGRFVAEIRPGERLLDLLISGSNSGFLYLDEAALPADTVSDLDLGTVRLEEGQRLRGRCIYPDGTPVQKLSVSAQLAEPAPEGGFRRAKQAPRAEYATGAVCRNAWTDAAGRFDLLGLRPGPYQVLSEVPLAEGAAWSTGGPEFDIVVARYRLLVEVVGHDGVALEDARVAFTRLTPSGEPAEKPLRTFAFGLPSLASMTVVPGETLAALAVAPGCAAAERLVAILPETNETHLRVELVREDRSATLVLRPRSGRGADWRVDLCAPLSRTLLPGLGDLAPDPDGRVHGLPLGEHWVRLEPSSWDDPAGPRVTWGSGRRVTLVAGETELEFDPLPAARVRLLFGAPSVHPSANESHLHPAAAPRHPDGETTPGYSPIHLKRLEGGGSGHWDWLVGYMSPVRASCELEALGADGEHLLRRVSGLSPRAGQCVDLMAPASPLRLRLVLDDRLVIQRELTPAPGETVEILVPLGEAPRGR